MLRTDGFAFLLLLIAAVSAEAAAADAPGYTRLRMVEVLDEQGFGEPVVALRFLAPVDWRIEGGVTWNVPRQCTGELVAVHVRATAADGMHGFEIFPSQVWHWSDDPSEIELWRMDASPGNRCTVAPPMGAADFLIESLPGTFRPPFEVQSVEALPAVAEALAAQSTRMQAMQMPFQADAARVRVRYDAKAGAIEEWLTAAVFEAAMKTISSGAAMQGRMEMTTQHISSASRIFGFRAPAGGLEQQERLFATMVASVQVNPVWEAALGQVALDLEQIQLRGGNERSRVWSEAMAEVASTQAEAWRNHQVSQSRLAEAWSQTIRGFETYVDPADGEAALLSSGFEAAWSNGAGEYVLSDQPDFDPNTVLTDQDWHRLERRS
jgi:hypothetical protein